MKTQRMSTFLGMNNKLPDFALHVDKTGDFQRLIENADVDNAGRIRSRNGTLRVQTQTAPHSVYQDRLMVRASKLYALTLPTYTETELVALTSDAPMSYVTLGADTYYSNGTDSGRIAAGVAYPMGLPTPTAPACSVISGGLLPGLYQVSVAYVNTTTGEEGGVSASTSTELTTTGGLRVTLPGASTGATHVNVYLSECNGTEVYRATTVTAATATVDLTALATGRAAVQRFETPLPAGMLFTSNGRLCSIANGDRHIVYVGLPWRFGYHQTAGGYLEFQSEVSLGVENQGGTYICSDKTYWFTGDLGNWIVAVGGQGQVVDVAPHGAVPGTAFAVPDSTKVGWFGTSGLILADTQGGIEEVMEERIDLTAPASGSSVVFESDGYTRVVSCGWCVNLGNKAISQYTGYDFTSTSGNYGTKADGIYLLDTPGDVDSVIGLGKLSFGAEELKHLPNLYIGVASESRMELTAAWVDAKGVDREYTYPAIGFSESMMEQRIDLGRGIRANWIDLTLRNGGAFTLESVSPLPKASNRRI